MEKQLDKTLVIQYILQGELEKGKAKSQDKYVQDEIRDSGRSQLVAEVRKKNGANGNRYDLVGWFER